MYALALGCAVVVGQAGGFDAARDAQLEWAEKIVNLRVQFRIESDHDSPELQQAGVSAARIEGEWIYTDSGALRHHMRLLHDERVVHQSLQVCNGQRFADVSYETGESDLKAPRIVTLYTATLDRTGTRALFTPFMELWDPITRTWLGERLEHPRFEDFDGLAETPGFRNITRWEYAFQNQTEHEGSVVVRVLRRHFLQDGAVQETDLELDAHYSYLPRSVLILGALAVHEFKVDEFNELQPGWWLPWRGTLVTPESRQHWELTQAALNTDLPSDLFEPPLAVGTYVSDTVEGKAWVHGGEEGMRIHRARELNRAQDQAAAGAAAPPLPTQALSPSTDSAWRYLLLGIGAACIAAAVYFRRRA